MNDQERADALAEQLDTLLAGDSLPEQPAGEMADLLQLANQLTEATPAPRPDFGPALKESLLKSVADGGAGIAVTSGLAITGLIVAIVVGGVLVVLIALGLVVGGLLQNQATPTPEGSSVPVSVPDENAAPSVAPSPPVTKATVVPQATNTHQAVDTLTLPAPSPTTIIDVLPPITITVETTDQIVSPPELVPGQPSSGSDDDDDDGGSGGGRGSNNDEDDDDDD